ncbi:MAG: hypothetical protein WBQ23_06370 [Bacteroidota bacterium]
MFISLLAATFFIALLVSFIVTRIFTQPIQMILSRIVAEEMQFAWSRYMTFAMYVVGISGGVRMWELERYITAPSLGPDATILHLSSERWVLEVYRTIIETLQGIAWLLLIFFIFTLMAYIVLRIIESRRAAENPIQPDNPQKPPITD